MDVIRSEIKNSNLWLEYDEPRRFVIPMGSKCSLFYLFYRIFMAAYFASMWMYSYLDSTAYAKWFIYLTHWSFTVLTCSSILSAICVVEAYMRTIRVDSTTGIEKNYKMPASYKVMWVLNNLGFSSAIIVSCIYWAAVHDPKDGLNLQNTSTHISNTMYVLLDMCIVCIPIRLLHVWHILTYCISYTCFSYLYYLLGGTNEDGKQYIYKILDYYNRPLSSACLLFTSYIAVCVLHFVYFVIARLRNNIITSYRIQLRVSPMTKNCEKLLPTDRYV